MSTTADHYDAIYGNFDQAVAALIRRETYGEDIGQTSWLTADDFRLWISWLNLPPAARVLEIGCGSGGPALFFAKETGAHLVGLDISDQAIAAATALAHAAALGDRVTFMQADAGQPLPLADASFDAIVCIDALNHLPHRADVFVDWRRLLRPGGRLLCTDPTIVNGLLGSGELVDRTLNGPSFFSPPGEDERLLTNAGFQILRVDDGTPAAAEIATRRLGARERRRATLLAVEGDERFARVQRLYSAVATLARERRLVRTVLLAQR